MHEKLGHPAEEMVKLTGNYMKLSIRGRMDNCGNCAIGKMWQKNVEKGPKVKSSKPGFHLYINIALSKFTSAGGSKYWFLAVDEATHINSVCSYERKVTLKRNLFRFLKNYKIHMGDMCITFDVTMRERIEHLKMHVSTRNWDLYLNIQHPGHLNKMA